ncbi:MAG: MarR family winged helix-turn-helix transcriptional regulator [Micromonosporaceae bacterium]
MQEEAHGSRDGIPQALGRLRVALDDAFQRASRDLGLTAQQAELLCAAMRPAAVGDLAAALRCDRSNVTRLVDRAAAHDLVRRRQGADRRVSMIELSPKGEQLARRFIAALEAQTAELRASWSNRRKRQATELLDEISAALLPASAPQSAPPRD